MTESKRPLRAGLLGLVAASAVLMACSNKHISPILVNRGVEQYEREYFVNQESFGVDNRLTKIFLQGYIEEGMSQNMVNMLWGPPDREFDDGNTWEYVTKEGNIISRVKFKKSDVPRLGEYENIVATIEGDRYGGSLPPGQGPATK